MANRKTKFQQYLDRVNNTPETSKMSDDVKLSYTKSFYEIYLENFREVDTHKGLTIFNGTSKDGNCIVTQYGGLYCESTGMVANPISFLLSSEQLLTDVGAHHRYLMNNVRTIDPGEGTSASILDKEHLLERVSEYRIKSHMYDMYDKYESFGLNRDDTLKHPFWFDGLNRFFYLNLSDLDFPLCKYECRFDGDYYEDSQFGVPRLFESPGADRIFFVENILQFVSLTELYPEPVYLAPSATDYLTHDYGRLMKGKQVVCVSSKKARSADPKSFNLDYLKSHDPLDLLKHYKRAKPKSKYPLYKSLYDSVSEQKDEASASIKSYLRDQGIKP